MTLLEQGRKGAGSRERGGREEDQLSPTSAVAAAVAVICDFHKHAPLINIERRLRSDVILTA